MPEPEREPQASSTASSSSHRILLEILETLQQSTIVNRGGKDVRSRFWTTYRTEAAEYDGEFLDKYKSDMDIVLIFAGLFSAVSTSFIVSLESNLGPNPTDTTNALLKLLIHTIDNSTFSGQTLELPTWNGPGSTVVWIQAVMYASLSASLLAALGAVLGKQWLSHYSRHGRGTIAARGRRRQQKFDGLQAWYFDAVLEVLPLLLQISLLLFGTALGSYLWTQQQTVASVVIGTTAFGVLFYVVIVLSSLASRDCPYQTPASAILRTFTRGIIQYYEQLQGNYAKVALMFRLMLYIPYYAIQTLGSLPVQLNLAWKRLVRVISRSSPMSSEALSSPELSTSDKNTEPSDAPSILWILETSTDPEVITAAAKMVPDVEWSSDLDVSGVLLQLRDSFLGCFEKLRLGHPLLVPLGRDRALACGRALLHIYLERQNNDHRNLPPLFDAPLLSTANYKTHLPSIEWLGSLRLDTDTDLAFICLLLRNVFVHSTYSRKLVLPDIPDVHLAWFIHPLLHCLCDSKLPLKARNVAVDAISRLLHVTLPPRNVLADCLLAIGLLTGLPTHRRELIRLDKSDSMETILKTVLQQLQQALPSRSNSCLPTYRSLCAVRLLEPLSNLLQVRDFRRIFYACCIPLWSLHVSKALVQEALRGVSLPSNKAWSHARSTLHFSISTGSDLNLAPDVVQRMWDLDGLKESESNREEALITIDVQWLIEYIEHFRALSDEIAVGDALLALSVMLRVIHYEKKAMLMETMIWAMGPSMSVRTRHASLKLAQTLRGVLSHPKDEPFQTILFTEFSPALCFAAFPRPYTRPSDFLYHPDQAFPDDFLFYERDLSYLQIVFCLSRNDAWNDLLHRDGHYKRCNIIARALQYVTLRDSQRSHMSAYVVATLGRPVLQEMPADSISGDIEWTLTFKAWDFIRYGPGADVSAMLPAMRSIVEYTMSLVSKQSIEVTEEFIDCVQSSLRRLKRGAMDVQEPILLSVEALVNYMKENGY